MSNYYKLCNRTSKRNRIYKHIPRILGTWKTNNPCAKFPISIEIFPTNRCNLKCKFCSYDEILNGEQLSNQSFTRLIDEIINSGINSVVFSGGGEPTLHPLLSPAINKLTDANIKVGLITNGIYLTTELLKSISKCSWIRFSLNANSKVQYLRLTSNSEENFDKIAENIKLITSQKLTTLVSGAIILVDIKNFNKMDFINSIELASTLALDQIFFKPLQNKFEINTQSKKNFVAYSDEISSYAQKFKIVTNFKKFISEEYNPYMSKEAGQRCSVVYDNLIGLITASGDVYSCLYQYIHLNDTTYGNINAISLKEIYKNRKHMIDKITSAECNFCKYGNIIAEIHNLSKNKSIKHCRDPHSDFI